jgi:hypothetical protein
MVGLSLDDFTQISCLTVTIGLMAPPRAAACARRPGIKVNEA